MKKPKLEWTVLGKQVSICLGIFSFAYLFKYPICKLINTVLVDPLLKEFITNTFSLIILASLAVIFSLLTLKKILGDKLYPSLISIIHVFTLLSIYFVILRDNTFFHSIRINKTGILAYSDLLLPLLAYIILNFKSNRLLLNDVTKEKFVEDDAYSLINKDVLGRKGFAKHISEIISNSTSNRAFAISVVGAWGSGKSVFMKFVEEELDNTNEIIHFNPWKVSDIKTTFEDFFSSLTNKVKKYDIIAAGQLKEYAKHIIEIDDNIISKIANQTLKLFDNNLSLTEQFQRLNSLIMQTGKRYIVFIDDIDRLTGSEVIQVLKLVRNTADFGNVFFVVAIDYGYVIKSMSNTKEVALESQYLQKIFQFELILPPIRKDFIKETFKKIMGFENMLPYDREELERTIDYLIFDRHDFAVHMFPGMKFEGNLEIAIDNLRDLIRFANSFKISYRILKGEVDLHDLIMIELIKLRSIPAYNSIGTFQILKEVDHTTPKRIEIDYEKFKKLIGDYEHDLELKRVKILLDSLFTTPKKFYQTLRSINYPKNVEIYFHYQLFNQIPLKEFRELRNKSLQEILEKVKRWEEEGKGAAISQLLQEMRDFANWDEFRKFIHLFLILGDSPKNRDWIIYAYSYFADETIIVKMFTINDEATVTKAMVEVFLEEVFSSNSISNYAKSEFASFFLDEFRRKEFFQFKDKQYWIDKANEAFENFLSDQNGFAPIFYEYLYNSIDHVEPDSRKVILDSKACSQARDFISKNSDSYLPFLMRPYYSPPNDIWTFDPFIDQIFLSFDAFEPLLLNSSSKNEMVSMAKKYLARYKEGKANNEPFQLEKKDVEKVIRLHKEQNN